jgi:hypothetical protein
MLLLTHDLSAMTSYTGVIMEASLYSLSTVKAKEKGKAIHVTGHGGP